MSDTNQQKIPGESPYRIAGIPSGIISADDIDVTDEAFAALTSYNGLVEQLETFLDAAWKFEQEMANGEFVHFGEFRRALVAASGADRASNPAKRPS